MLGLHMFESLAFWGNVEVRCKPPDLYVGVFGRGEGFGYSADRSVSTQNTNSLSASTVGGVSCADDGFRGLAGQLATPDFGVVGCYHSTLFREYIPGSACGHHFHVLSGESHDLLRSPQPPLHWASHSQPVYREGTFFSIYM